MPQPRVDFFIAGVQKGGTTALDAMLRRHPRIQMARVKELHFFDRENDWSAPNLYPLHSQFDWEAPNVLRGEATPVYVYWQAALTRLKAYNPHARLIVGLRHPSFRAYSHWRMETRRGRETLEFFEAISTGRARVSGAPDGQHRIFSYVERGFYDQQIERLCSIFLPEQVHFFRTDSLWTNLSWELTRIERFLGVEEFLGRRAAGLAAARSADPIALGEFERHYLERLYAPTISKLGARAGLDFEDWKRADYREPM